MATDKDDSSYSHLARLWTRLTRPSDAIADPVARRDARLLSAVVLVFALLYLMTSLLRVSRSGMTEPLFLFSFAASTVSVAALYALSRTRHFRLTVLLADVYVGVIVFAMLASDVRLTLENNTLTYFMLAVVLTGLLFSVRATAIVAAVAVALTALVTLVFAPPDLELQAGSMLQMNTIIAGLSVALAVVLQQNRRTIAAQARSLQESEASHRTLFDALSDPVMVHRQGIIARVNPAFETVFGYTEAEVVGQPAILYAAPESRALIAEKAQSLQVERYEALALHRDGSTFPIEISSRPYTHQGDWMRVSVIRDISERKAAERALIEERNLLQTVINTIPDQVYVKDTESRFVLVNQALLQRYNMQRPDDVLGKTDFDLFGPEIAQRFYDGERALLASGAGATTTYDSRETLPDLSPLWVQVTKVPLLDSSGRIAGVLGINRDITDYRRAEQQRLDLALERQRVEILRRFIAGLSHDLNTPLAALKTGLYLLRRTIDDPDQRQRRMDGFEEQVDRLAAMVADLLDLDRLERGVEPLGFAPVSLDTLLAPVIAGGEALAAQHEQIFTTAIEPGLPPVVVNAEMMRQALDNLLTNAALYTPARGTITLAAHRAGAHIDIAVRDNGIGIEPADLTHIFEGFYRADKARSSGTGRSGLGLAIARRIALAHGGDITVVSEPGAGSTFTLQLPVMPDT